MKNKKMFAMKEVTSYLLSSYPVLVISDMARHQVAGTCVT